MRSTTAIELSFGEYRLLSSATGQYRSHEDGLRILTPALPSFFIIHFAPLSPSGGVIVHDHPIS
ncbi:MAG TPA: hypothetical protein VKQ08_07510, partial [Cyclobacteriaceae bacterium]|nr:hypothetical protein [Cyclobacteriaceae bacterium]